MGAGTRFYSSDSSDSSEGQQGDTQERLQVALRCVADLCVFAATRGQSDQQHTRQGLLFPDMPLSQWRDVVHGTTNALFD
jgi:hypothetical protein